MNPDTGHTVHRGLFCGRLPRRRPEDGGRPLLRMAPIPFDCAINALKGQVAREHPSVKRRSLCRPTSLIIDVNYHCN